MSDGTDSSVFERQDEGDGDDREEFGNGGNGIGTRASADLCVGAEDGHRQARRYGDGLSNADGQIREWNGFRNERARENSIGIGERDEDAEWHVGFCDDDRAQRRHDDGDGFDDEHGKRKERAGNSDWAEGRDIDGERFRDEQRINSDGERNCDRP